MSGKIRFGDEEEARQAEALAGRMIEDVATQHEIVGEVARAAYVAPSWDRDVMVVNSLRIEFTSGVVVTAPQARLDLSRACGFREALRAENARQAASASQGGWIRETGEALADHPGPKLDAKGDPVNDEYENPTAYPVAPPSIEGTEITKDSGT